MSDEEIYTSGFILIILEKPAHLVWINQLCRKKLNRNCLIKEKAYLACIIHAEDKRHASDFGRHSRLRPTKSAGSARSKKIKVRHLQTEFTIIL
jgi:hypothetical protein